MRRRIVTPLVFSWFFTVLKPGLAGSPNQDNENGAFPEYITLALSKLKTFAHSSTNEAKMVPFFLDWEENIKGKGENAAYQHFILFPQYFQKVSFLMLIKVNIVQQRVGYKREIWASGWANVSLSKFRYRNPGICSVLTKGIFKDAVPVRQQNGQWNFSKVRL